VRVAVVLLIIGWSLRAGADPTQEAQDRAAAGDFVGAAQKYREAFAASPKPELLCNVGVAYYKAKDLPRADWYLSHCLDIGSTLAPAFLESVKKVLAAVEDKLQAGDFAPISLLITPSTATTTIAGVYDEPIPVAKKIWLPFGHHELKIHAEGYDDQMVPLDWKNREMAALSIVLTKSEAKIELPKPKLERQPEQPEPVLTSQPRSRLMPVIATSATVGFAGGAVIAWVLARGKASDAGKASAANNFDAYTAASDAARSRQHIAWGLGGVAVVGAIVSGYFWYHASVEVTPTATTVAYVARF
jgi:hypothetical protein